MASKVSTDPVHTPEEREECEAKAESFFALEPAKQLALVHDFGRTMLRHKWTYLHGKFMYVLHAYKDRKKAIVADLKARLFDPLFDMLKDIALDTQSIKSPEDRVKLASFSRIMADSWTRSLKDSDGDSPAVRIMHCYMYKAAHLEATTAFKERVKSEAPGTIGVALNIMAEDDDLEDDGSEAPSICPEDILVAVALVYVEGTVSEYFMDQMLRKRGKTPMDKYVTDFHLSLAEFCRTRAIEAGEEAVVALRADAQYDGKSLTPAEIAKERKKGEDKLKLELVAGQDWVWWIFLRGAEDKSLQAEGLRVWPHVKAYNSFHTAWQHAKRQSGPLHAYRTAILAKAEVMREVAAVTQRQVASLAKERPGHEATKRGREKEREDKAKRSRDESRGGGRGGGRGGRGGRGGGRGGGGAGGGGTRAKLFTDAWCTNCKMVNHYTVDCTKMPNHQHKGGEVGANKKCNKHRCWVCEEPVTRPKPEGGAGSGADDGPVPVWHSNKACKRRPADGPGKRVPDDASHGGQYSGVIAVIIARHASHKSSAPARIASMAHGSADGTGDLKPQRTHVKIRTLIVQLGERPSHTTEATGIYDPGAEVSLVTEEWIDKYKAHGHAVESTAANIGLHMGSSREDATRSYNLPVRVGTNVVWHSFLALSKMPVYSKRTDMLIGMDFWERAPICQVTHRNGREWISLLTAEATGGVHKVITRWHLRAATDDPAPGALGGGAGSELDHSERDADADLEASASAMEAVADATAEPLPYVQSDLFGEDPEGDHAKAVAAARITGGGGPEPSIASASVTGGGGPPPSSASARISGGGGPTEHAGAPTDGAWSDTAGGGGWAYPSPAVTRTTANVGAAASTLTSAGGETESKHGSEDAPVAVPLDEFEVRAPNTPAAHEPKVVAAATGSEPAEASAKTKDCSKRAAKRRRRRRRSSASGGEPDSKHGEAELTALDAAVAESTAEARRLELAADMGSAERPRGRTANKRPREASAGRAHSADARASGAGASRATAAGRDAESDDEADDAPFGLQGSALVCALWKEGLETAEAAAREAGRRLEEANSARALRRLLSIRHGGGTAEDVEHEGAASEDALADRDWDSSLLRQAALEAVGDSNASPVEALFARVLATTKSTKEAAKILEKLAADKEAEAKREEAIEEYHYELKMWAWIAMNEAMADLSDADVVRGKGRFRRDYTAPFVKDLIKTAPGVKPQRGGYHRTYSGPEAEFLRKTLDGMLEADQIKETNSPWDPPVLVVPKWKNGAKVGYRLVFDLRALNAVTEPMGNDPPLVWDILTAMSGMKYMSDLDLQDGYYQLELDECDMFKTGFTVSLLQNGKKTTERFEMRVASMGLLNSQAAFIRAVNTALKERLGKDIFTLSDDVTAATPDVESHKVAIQFIVKAALEWGFRFNPKKCKFGLTKMCKFGFVIGDDQIRIDPARAAIIQQYPRPEDKADIRVFLGAVQYFRPCIKGCSGLSAPLNDLLKDNVPFEWGDRQEAAFTRLKEIVGSDVVMMPRDFKRRLYIDVDAGPDGVGAVAYHIVDGHRRAVWFHSKRLEKHQINYSTTEKELFGLVHALDKLESLICGLPCTINTDARNVVWLFQRPNSADKIPAHRAARITGWIERLQGQTNITIQHVPAERNKAADAMSRAFERARRWTMDDRMRAAVDPVVRERDDIILDDANGAGVRYVERTAGLTIKSSLAQATPEERVAFNEGRTEAARDREAMVAAASRGEAGVADANEEAEEQLKAWAKKHRFAPHVGAVGEVAMAYPTPQELFDAGMADSEVGQLYAQLNAQEESELDIAIELPDHLGLGV